MTSVCEASKFKSLLEVLMFMIGAHAGASFLNVTLKAHKSSVLVGLDSDALCSEGIDGLFGSMLSTVGTWAPINLASTLFSGTASPDVDGARLHTFCAFDALLPVVVSGEPTLEATKKFETIINEKLAVMFQETFTTFWPYLCPTEPINITFTLNTKRPETFSVVPWTGARLVTDPDPKIILMDSWCSWTRSSLFEVKLDFLRETLVVRNYDGHTLESSMEALAMCPNFVTKKADHAASPPRIAAVRVKRFRERDALEDRSSTPVLGTSYNIKAIADFDLDLIADDFRPVGPGGGGSGVGGGARLTRSVFDNSVYLYLCKQSLCALRPDSSIDAFGLKRVKAFGRICSRVSSIIRASTSQDAVGHWTIGAFTANDTHAFGPVAVSAAEFSAYGPAAVGLPEFRSAQAFEVGYCNIQDTMVSVLAINVFHPVMRLNWTPESNAQIVAFLIDASVTMFSQLCKIDRSYVSSMVFQNYGLLCEHADFMDRAVAAPVAAPVAPVAASVAPVPAVLPTLPTDAAPAPPAPFVPIADWSATAFDPSVLSFDLDAMAATAAAAAAAPLVPLVPLAPVPMPWAFSGASSGAAASPLGPLALLASVALPKPRADAVYNPTGRFSTTYHAWQAILSDSVTYPLPEVSSLDPTSHAQRIKSRIGGKSFAQPLEHEKRTQGGNNRDVSQKMTWLYREIVDAAAKGVSVTMLQQILDASGAFYTKTRSSAAPPLRRRAAASPPLWASVAGGAAGGHEDENMGQEEL